jgi:hypothetical protein
MRRLGVKRIVGLRAENVEYCRFEAVFRQRKFSTGWPWCRGVKPGFAISKLKIELRLGNFSLLLQFNIEPLLMHPLWMGCYENSSLKILILVNRLCFTTCGWATFA